MLNHQIILHLDWSNVSSISSSIWSWRAPSWPHTGWICTVRNGSSSTTVAADSVVSSLGLLNCNSAAAWIYISDRLRGTVYSCRSHAKRISWGSQQSSLRRRGLCGCIKATGRLWSVPYNAYFYLAHYPDLMLGVWPHSMNVFRSEDEPLSM